MHPLKRRIEKGEGMHLDFKFSISDSLKIAKSFVAFANTKGGSLLIGVKDCGKISGIVSDEERFMAKKAAEKYTFPKVAFQTKEWIIEGKKVLEISIPEGKNKPHFLIDKKEGKQSFIRYEDNNVLASSVWVKMQEKRSSPDGIYIKYTALEKELLEYLEKHLKVSFKDLKEVLFLENEELTDLLSDFWSMDIIKVEIEEDKLYFSL